MCFLCTHLARKDGPLGSIEKHATPSTAKWFRVGRWLLLFAMLSSLSFAPSLLLFWRLGRSLPTMSQ
jgi:hypothetical protein